MSLKRSCPEECCKEAARKGLWRIIEVKSVKVSRQPLHVRPLSSFWSGAWSHMIISKEWIFRRWRKTYGFIRKWEVSDSGEKI